MTTYAVRWADRAQNTVYSRVTYDSENFFAVKTAKELGYVPVDEADFNGVTVLYNEIPAPTVEGRLDKLEAALAQTDETAIELYEANEEQIQINAAQDEALIEIYEMLEG